MIDDDLRLQANEELPQVVDQRLGEEGSPFLDIVFLENIVAELFNVSKVGINLRQVLLSFVGSVSLLDGRKEEDGHAAERLLVHEASG